MGGGTTENGKYADNHIVGGKQAETEQNHIKKHINPSRGPAKIQKQ